MRKFAFAALVLIVVALVWRPQSVEESDTGTEAVELQVVSRQASLSRNLPQPRKATPLSGNLALGTTPEEVAARYLEMHRDAWGLRDYHKLHPTVFRTPLGTRINYSVYQDQIPIIGMEVRIQVDRDLRVSRVENEYRPLNRVEIPSDLPQPAELMEGKFEGMLELDRGAAMTDAPVLVPVSGSDEPVIAFMVPAREKGNRRRPVQLLLRADDGQVIRRSVSRAEFH